MAKQNNIFKLKGTIGDVTFYKTQDGHLVREKTGLDGDRIKTDPKFLRTRENGAEFGNAGKDGQLIRTAFKTLVGKAGDNRVTSRMVENLMLVVKTDTVSARGERRALNGDLALLQGFEFNVKARLSVSFKASYDVSIDRAGGSAVIAVGDLIPSEQLSYPEGATHYKLSAAAAVVDFNAATVTVAGDEGAGVAISNVAEPGKTLTMALPAASVLPVFVVFGVSFYQQVNNTLYSLSNGAYNAFAIVKADA